MREIRLAEQALEPPALKHFRLESLPTPCPGPGQVLVRNSWMIVTAAMRTLMGATHVPLPMYRPGQALHGPTLGQVVESASEALPPGSWVRHDHGWRDHVVAEPERLRRVEPASGTSRSCCRWASH